MSVFGIGQPIADRIVSVADLPGWMPFVTAGVPDGVLLAVGLAAAPGVLVAGTKVAAPVLPAVGVIVDVTPDARVSLSKRYTSSYVQLVTLWS